MKIYSQKKKQNLNITLSVKICQQKDSEFLKYLETLQKEIVECIPLKDKIQIYKYPVDSIHFSLLNFTSFKLDVDFKHAREIIELQKWYLDFLDYVNKKILKVLPITTFEFEKFYTEADGSIKGSIALNLRNVDKEWWNTLRKIELEASRELKKLKIPVNGFQIKNPGGFFVINLLRFFGEEDCLVGESHDLEKLLQGVKFPKLKVTCPIVVISDPYLSNEAPQIAPEASFPPAILKGALTLKNGNLIQ